MRPIFTKQQADLIASTTSGTIKLTLDLGISHEEISVEEGFALIHGEKIPQEQFKNLKESVCYVIDEGAVKKVAFFSDKTNFYYKLMPTKDWPTFTLSSTPMHRYTFISPKEDVMSVIESINPIHGELLDTCCGIGYTAIAASKSASHVNTFEIDENVLFLASFNPYSEELFNNKKITVHQGDAFEGIDSFKPGFFDRIIHDPPTFKYSPMLYSRDFYKKLFKVLSPKGILYHYCPCPKKTKGNEFHTGISRRLAECGFKGLVYQEKSSGIIGHK